MRIAVTILMGLAAYIVWASTFAPPTEAQPGRTAPEYGIEEIGSIRTPELGFAAWTILPSPM